MRKSLLILPLLCISLFGDFYFNKNQKVELKKLHAYAPLRVDKNFKSKISYYKNSSGLRLGVEDKIIVCFSDLSIQEYIEKEYSLSFIRSITKNMYVYRVKDKDIALKIANRLNSEKGIKFSHPDFVVDKKTRSNDPLFDSQWHLDRIDVEGAWRYTRGAGVVVGVYDEGIDLEHEDLRENIIGFGNYSDGYKQLTMIKSYSQLNNRDKNAPRSSTDFWHGTACAGIVAAKADNFKGGAGVAPEAKLIVARYSKDNISNDSQALVDMANEGASIITNSWGTNSMFPSFEETLKLLSEKGRDGKGVLVFFAAGNDGCNMDRYYEVISDDPSDPRVACRDSSNFAPINDESESPYVLSVASATYNNRIASYSNYGSAIDFVAPGGANGDSIITTDAMGYKGFSSGNYTPWSNGFSGTSASAPMVAGVAALVLSANPSLTKEEVVDILKSTARKLGQYEYKNGRNDHWGYGMVNANEAVKMAINYGEMRSDNFATTIYKDLHKN